MKSLRDYINVIVEAGETVPPRPANVRSRAAYDWTQKYGATHDPRTGAPLSGQGATPTPAPAPAATPTPAPAPAATTDPKVPALQKEIQGIQQQIAASQKAGDQRAVQDYNVQLYGAQSDLAKLTGGPAPAPVAGSGAAYGNIQIAKQGQQQQINKGQEELRVAQASGDQAAAQAAQAKVDQATANKADITWADKDHAYGTISGQNLTPSTGPVQGQAAAPTPAPAPAPKPAAPAIPPAQLKKWQGVLNAEGYPTTADGVWGPGTQKSVRAFQTANGIPATGQIDKETADALNSFAATPVAGSSQIRTTVTPASESISRSDKELLNKMLTIAGLR